MLDKEWNTNLLLNFKLLKETHSNDTKEVLSLKRSCVFGFYVTDGFFVCIYFVVAVVVL